ncbi:MAG: translocation/assembly module TamB domain-containing protein [Chitinophagaceae bacterium]|nr:translocation/assembly module TamB domain-containing protein [Chitinophagaceae bacterium]
MESANINALVLTYGDGAEIEFEKSDFTLNGKQWTIDENGKLSFRRNSPVAGNLVMYEGDQRINLHTEKSQKGDWNDLKADLTKINLGDIGPFIMPKNRLEGLVTGNILIEDPTGKMVITSDNVKTDQLRLDNDSLGEVKAIVKYSNTEKELSFNGNTVNQENNLIFDGHIFLNPEKAKDNKIALKAKRFEIKVLERFLGTLFTDMQGYLTGNVDLEGAFKNIAVTGKGKLENAGLKVIFTQCFYKIKDTNIELTPEEINLDGLTLIDTVTKNPVYITGGIEHSSFKSMLYKLEVSTKKPRTTDTIYNRPVLLLNTTIKDNKQFYGRVKGTGSLSVSGTDKDMYITIDAKASERDSSFVTLPPSSSRESGMADFLVERKYGREMDESDFKKKNTNLTYDVRLTANPAVTVRMILDDLTGDEIKGKGKGTLNIRSGSSEPLTLRGRFDIDEGDYLFTFQSFFKKPFVLERGEKNYIIWDGDPYGATMNVTAAYTASKVNLTPLATLLNSDDNNLQGQREDVYVTVNLTDSLFKPKYSFSLKFPENSRVNTDPSLALGVQQLEKNENELNKQVAYLIVLNSFAPLSSQSSTGSAMGNTLNEFAYSTFSSISGLLFNEISKVVNDAFAQVSGNRVGFNISGSVYNRNLLEQRGSNLIPNQSQLDINIPIYISDRFYVKLGSRLDLALQNTSTVQKNILFLPDVTLEWLINESGTLRASLFYQQNIDALNVASLGQTGKSTRYGGSVSLRKDFNKPADLFNFLKRKKNKKNKQETSAPAGEAKKEEPAKGAN